MNPITVDSMPVLLPPSKADDLELAARFARGDAEALEDVIECYQSRVAGLAARLLGGTDDIHDVTQEVFISAMRVQKRFRAEASLWTWLAAITVNRCRSIQRRRWLHHKMLQTVAPLMPRTSTDKSPGIEQNETAATVRAAITALSAKSREVIVLYYLEELSVAQVAQILNLRRNTVEVRLTRARQSLANALRHLND